MPNTMLKATLLDYAENLAKWALMGLGYVAISSILIAISASCLRSVFA